METFLWVEKHRPKSINECVLPDHLKNTFKEFVEDKHIPNLILSGGPGIGKTTVAKAMLDEIGATSLVINESTINSTSSAWIHGRVSQELWIYFNL